MLVNPKKEIKGVLLPEKNIIVDANGKVIGHMFADGYVYNQQGIAVDKFVYDGSGFYAHKTGRLLPKGNVVDMNGNYIGLVNDNGKVIDVLGTELGQIDAKGRMFDEKGNYKGGIVRTGVGIGYDGSYLGYVSKKGTVIDVDGNLSGYVGADGHVLNKNKQLVGEVIEENIVIDVQGNVKGYLNALGDIIGIDDKIETTVLPGGASNKNYSVLKRGVILNYSGHVIGQVAPDGSIISTDNQPIGRILSTGQAVNNKGVLIGEIIEGDIIISDEDKVIGYINAEGKALNFEHSVIGKVISSNLVVDNNGKIMGHTYKIGANILGNDGKYFGRLAPDGRVLSLTNGRIGYLKSNGSYVNGKNQVAGYVLDEVAQNRRN